jgi:predicted negative regulator of RcsB-dependent stress response
LNILKKLFSKKPEALLERGERLFVEQHFYEARCVYEDALSLLQNRSRSHDEDVMLDDCMMRITGANHALAELNIAEAELAHGRGLFDKAAEHLELAKSLTKDATLREKADVLLAAINENINDTEVLDEKSACSTCRPGEPEEAAMHDSIDIDMPLMEYYDLLIQQLPQEMHARYTGLGEEFACFYVAASKNRHEDALEQLDKWHDGTNEDIYRYEKGMVLYRLGKVGEALSLLQESIRANAANSLAHLGLAMMLIDCNRLDEAGHQLDAMISDGMLAEQSSLLRADVYLLAGDAERAIEGYSRLLNSPSARAAAMRLHDALEQSGRSKDAAHVYKRYLSGCCH